MPMGPSPLGFVYFISIKFVGYTAAAYVLKKAFTESPAAIASVGAARTGIGVGTGLLYGGLWFFLATKVFHTDDPGHGVQAAIASYGYLAGLLPVRIGEWLLLLHLFFDRNLKNRAKDVKTAFAGAAWSYCLDAIGIGAALVIPGGIWVC